MIKETEKIDLLEKHNRHEFWSGIGIPTISVAIALLGLTTAGAAYWTSFIQSKIAQQAREDAYNQVRLTKRIEGCLDIVAEMNSFSLQIDQSGLIDYSKKPPGGANSEWKSVALDANTSEIKSEKLFQERTKVLGVAQSLKLTADIDLEKLLEQLDSNTAAFLNAIGNQVAGGYGFGIDYDGENTPKPEEVSIASKHFEKLSGAIFVKCKELANASAGTAP